MRNSYNGFYYNEEADVSSRIVTSFVIIAGIVMLLVICIYSGLCCYVCGIGHKLRSFFKLQLNIENVDSRDMNTPVRNIGR